MKKFMTRTVAALAVVAAVLGSVAVANAGSIFRLYPGRVQTFTAMVYAGQPVRVEVRGARTSGRIWILTSGTPSGPGQCQRRQLCRIVVWVADWSRASCIRSPITAGSTTTTAS